MKNLFKKILVLTLVLVMVGCSSSKMTNEEAKAAHKAALDGTNAADSFELNGKMSMLIDGGGMKLETTSEISSKVEGLKTEDPKMQIHTKTSMFGSEMEGDIYYVGGNQYTNQDGKKVVQEGVDISEMLASADAISKMDLSLYDKIEGSKKGNTIVLTTTFTKDDITKLMEQTAGVPTEADQIKNSSGSFEIVIDSETNRMQSFKLKFDVEVEAEGQLAKVTMDMDYAYTNYDAAKVELPTDLDTYESAFEGSDDVKEVDLSFLDQKSIIEAGEYEVGTDIEAGEYFAFAAYDDGALLDVFNDAALSDAVHELFFYNSMIVTLQDKQYVDAFDCVLIPVAKVANLPEGQQGMFKVGLHIQPGEYTLTSEGFGEYTIYNNSLELAIVENDYVDEETTISLKDGQYLYISDVSITAK